jgi:hypothetical protein
MLEGKDLSGRDLAVSNGPTHAEGGRECGTCTLCCKVAAVEEFSKPNGVWCHHCTKGRCCSIYQARPSSCRSFYCQWMLQPSLGAEWKPERAKFALVRTDSGRRLTALVDPGFPSAWRRSPYFEALKRWAAEAAARLPEIYLVDVLIGQRCVVVLPDEEIDLDVLASGEQIHLAYNNTTAGRRIEVSKVKETLSDMCPTSVTQLIVPCRPAVTSHPPAIK